MSDTRAGRSPWNSGWNYVTACIKGTNKPSTEEDKHFLALALCGEVGELANVIKKEWRGDTNPEELRAKIREEMGDTLAYLRLLAVAYNEDLDEIIETVVIPKCKARWPEWFDEQDRAP